jgi:hypothetical protein
MIIGAFYEDTIRKAGKNLDFEWKKMGRARIIILQWPE